MQSVTNSLDFGFFGIMISIITMINIIIYMKKKSPDGYFDTQYWAKISIYVFETMIVLFGGISIIWLAFSPISFGNNIQLVAQLASINMLSEVISISIMWILKGRTSPLMKLQKKA